MKRLNSLVGGAIAALALLLAPAIRAAEASIAAQVQRTQTAGIDILVYPMDVKDVVTVAGSMPLGDAVTASRAGNPAVPEVAVQMLERGTTRRDKFAISDMLDQRGASLRIGIDTHQVRMRGKSMRADMPMIVDLLAEELRQPAFSADELAKVKAETKADLQSELDDTNAVASEALKLALYPRDTANGLVPNAEMMQAIGKVTLDDLRTFHQRNFGPAHMTLVFVGDVDLDEAKRAVENAFAGWSGGVAYNRGSGTQRTPEVLLRDIPLADKSSVSVRWGVPTGLMHGDPDALPLELGTSVLGEGFTSRLLGTIRDKEGLTYGIGAGAGGGDMTGGTFLIASSFAPQLLDRGIASTRRELDRWYRDGITAEELVDSKTAAIGRQRIRLETTGGMASALIDAIARGDQPSALDAEAARINAVTLEQVNAAIRKYGDPARLMVVRAGTFPDAK